MPNKIQAAHFRGETFYRALASTSGYNGYSLNIKTSIGTGVEIDGPVTTFVVYHKGEDLYETSNFQDAVDHYNKCIGASDDAL